MVGLRQSASLLRQALTQPTRHESPAVIAALNPWASTRHQTCQHVDPGCGCFTCGRVRTLVTASEATGHMASLVARLNGTAASNAIGQTISAWRMPLYGGIRYYAADSDGKQDSKEATSSDQDAKTEGEQAQESAPQPSVEELLAQKAELAAQVEKLTDALKREVAEQQNLLMRTKRDVDTAKKFAVQGFVKSVLDVADNLERASAAVPAHALNEGAEGPEGPLDADQLRKLLRSLLEGVSMTERVLLNIFKQQGIEQYNPLGEKFDPNQHEALYQVPDATKEVGTVAAVSKRGYKLHDRVIRPAAVGVVRAP